MEDNLDRISIEQFKNFIKTLDTSMNDYLYIMDLQNDYYCISKNAAVRFLLPSAEFNNVAENLQKVILPEDAKMVFDDIMLIREGKKQFHDLQYRWLDQEHRSVWINCRGRVLCDENGQPEYLIGCINEVGKKQMADNVSGLLGESSLKRDLVEHDGRLDGFMLRLGIDRFKEINENQGMDYGDMILRKTAECIASVIRPDQKLYRIVADEFAVVDFSGRDEAEAIRLYEDIRQSINRFIAENEYEVFYTISAGIMEFKSVVNHTYYNLMKLSEFSLNEAKDNGKNKYYTYTRADYHVFTHKKALTKIMRNAINNNFEGFDAHFQPIMDIKQNKLVGAETLMRFRCEEKGNVTPYEFVPLLEDSGLIIPVGCWILYKAMEACKEIQKEIPEFRVSVNISYVQVLRSNILDDIVYGLKKFDLKPESLII
ncbi:MAG: GGDEF and EAL domain-containing protein, partial [Lachnospiraceae bacterium]|nr:GGDEF and EAL domain-containing protein [Lachnospiraceae bacterium]